MPAGPPSTSFLSALMTNVIALGAWSLPQALVVVGIFRIMAAFVWGWFWQSFSQTSKLVNEGGLDFLLTKPLDPQFLVSTTRFSFNQLPSLLGGIALVVYGLHLLSYTPSFSTVLLSIWLFIISLGLAYCLYFITIVFCFYSERLNNVQHLFAETFYSTGRYPKEIYHPLVQRLLTSVLPVALIISVPANTLFSPPDWTTIIWLHFLLFVFLAVSRQFWLVSLRRYSSASS